MNIDDLAAFSELLGEAFDTLSDRGRPDEQRTATWFRVLAPYPLAAVVAGFEGHMRKPLTGRTLPVPSDIVAQIEAIAADDGRPGAEEAWAIALTSRDEADTVVWTAEIAHAWGVARHILAGGDEVGSRMAFRETYAAAVDQSRRAGRTHRWEVAEGHDPVRRVEAVRSAALQGRIPLAMAADVAALPAPRQPVALLAAPSGAGSMAAASQAEKQARQALAELRSRLSTPTASVSRDALAKQRTAELRHAAAERVATYEQKSGASQ